MKNHALQKMVHNLANEVTILRSVVISVVGKDSEGVYKPAFVKSVLKNAKNKAIGTFTNAQDFLRQIEKA